jgi:hypothetical protein
MQGMGVVVALGPTAEVGKIQRMMDEADAGETPLQHQLDVFGKYLSIITIIVAFLAFFLAWKGRGEAVDDAFAIAVGAPCCCTFVVCILELPISRCRWELLSPLFRKAFLALLRLHSLWGCERWLTTTPSFASCRLWRPLVPCP